MTDQEIASTDPGFEPTDRLENFLISLISFIQKFFFTCFDLALNQTRFSKAIKNQQSATSYTKPVTFIAVISLLAGRIFRFGTLTLLLFLGGFLNFSIISTTKRDYPSISEELILPDFTEMVLYGLFTLIIILLTSRFLRNLLLKKGRGSWETLITATYYSVGFQFSFYSLWVIVFSISMFLDEKYPSRFGWMPYVTIFFIPIVVIWAISVFYRLVIKTIPESQFRVTKQFWKQIWLMLWSIILVIATTLSEWGMVYLTVQPELERRTPKSIFTIGLTNFQETKASAYELNLLIRNNSEEVITLTSNGVALYGKLIHHGQIMDSCLGHIPFIILDPKDVCWVTILVDKNGPEYHALIFNYENTISFNSVNETGEAQTLTSYIYEDGKVVNISEYE